ncbi:synaptic vesicular amine transporter-like [Anarhichas minor]|uniref:synaptic vesicular amine transporter-like n=1 Tax=Anarhichas minor TaxID=65739 RepID=UPI003F73BA88
MQQHFLKLNGDKTELLFIGSKVKKIHNHILTIDGTSVIPSTLAHNHVQKISTVNWNLKLKYNDKYCLLSKLDLLTWLRQEAQLKKMILVIVFLTLFLDNMLLSVVVPILPSYLYMIGQAPTITPGNSTDLTVNPPVNQSLNNRSVILGSTSAPPHQTPALSSDSTEAQKFPKSNCSYSNAHLDEVNIKVGLLLASKSTIQLIINPFMGPLTDRIGYHIPVCAGFCIIFFATTLFAFSSSFILLLLARSVQGVGGSCLSVAGMSMLADEYKDDKERGRAMGISFSGLALGLMAGAPFGSVMYQFVGKMAPFLVLAVIAVLAGGTVFLTDSISYLIASTIFGYLSQKYNGSWLCACIGMILAGITTISSIVKENESSA